MPHGSAYVPHYNSGHDTYCSACPRYLDRILFGRAAARRCAAAAARRRSAPHHRWRTHIWVRHEATGAVSSTRLLPAIRELFDDSRSRSFRTAPRSRSAPGPGSFTGLRTATGVAQGLAFGLACRSCRSARCSRARSSRVCASRRRPRVLAALDARMDEVYWADFRMGHSRRRMAHDPAGIARLRRARSSCPTSRSRWRAMRRRLSASGCRRLRRRAASTAKRCRTRCPSRSPGCARCAPAARCRADQAAPEYVRDKVAQTTAERMDARAAKAAHAAAEDQRKAAHAAQVKHDGAGAVSGVLLADRYLSSMTEARSR